MTSVLGMELSAALCLLEKEGLRVQVQEVSCKKGPAGEDKRVVRQKMREDGSAELTFAGFRTEISE